MTVASGVTLTIDAGVVVKLNGQLRALTVNGTLSAIGTAGSRITFTSIQDDSVGGDSGGDGSTSGAPGQWYEIKIAAGTASRLHFVNVRYGGYGSSNTNYGAVHVSGSSTSASIEDATIADNQRSGLKVYQAGATVARSTIERNANGISVNQGWVAVKERTQVRNSSEDGVWFNLTSTYTGQASSLLDSDVKTNGRYGVNLGVSESLAIAKWPSGNRNNIFGNTTRQLDHYHTGQAIHDADWTMNYWGDGVEWAFNPEPCFSEGPQARGDIAYLSSGANPPDGPITWKSYLAGTSPNQVNCGFDLFRIAPSQFYRTYIDGNTPPPAMSFTSCQGGLHATTPTVCASDPVRTVSGSFDYEKTDLRLPGIGLPFAWTRTYHSQDLTGGPLGTGWTHSYAAALTIKASGDVTLRGEDGQHVEYMKQQDGSYLGAKGALSTLTKPGTSYELLRKDQVKYIFDSSGRLTSMRDRNAQGLTFAYDGSGRLQTITDSAARAITVTHNANGNLTSVASPDGRSVTYAYTNGKLTSVTDARGKVWTYTYDATYGWLKSETDPRQNRLFENTYSCWGRVTEQLDAASNRTTSAWDSATQTATVTDVRSNPWKDSMSARWRRQR